MLNWRIENTHSNIIDINGNKYQIRLARIEEGILEYKLLENGYPVETIFTFSESSISGMEIRLDSTRTFRNLKLCSSCGEYKIVINCKGLLKCCSCCQKEGIKQLLLEGKVGVRNKNQDIGGLLSFDRSIEAEIFLRRLPTPEIFIDTEREGFYFVKGVLKVQNYDDLTYEYYPVFFYYDELNHHICDTHFLIKRIEMLEFEWGWSRLSFRDRFQMFVWFDSIVCILNNFSAYEFQSAMFKTLSDLPIKNNGKTTNFNLF
ncbi:hypothetical protein M3175_17180 [Robertmurraya korlensis]|uniref:hypothetical protein n=1 Tax=Robertmurraya korlensis TaxID=519977 RepID=UPI002041D015|nr:hypothetical protein [Robertmurraya korlensis]MCM3602469.1 hypothetical protein [Robertmurraya korlensis]